jgi:2,4-dienoyl-CoA reductase-like NADH-dependent reductase (Old Yellow Enzyme family)
MSQQDGERFIEAGIADALAYGRDYIATPDLAERLRQGLPLNTPDKDTFYGEGPVGYTDYPRLLPLG